VAERKKAESKQSSAKDLEKRVAYMETMFRALEEIHRAMGWPPIELYMQQLAEREG
jgi:hypothetical protein